MTIVNVTTDIGFRAIARSRNHVWDADETIEGGGTDTGPTPPEALLGALGSCMAITAQMYAARKGWPVEKIEVNLELERYNAAEYAGYNGSAQYVHEISEQIIIHGEKLTDEQRTRLVEITGKCPVRRVLANPVFFVELNPEKPLDLV
jgi:putative redox protein